MLGLRRVDYIPTKKSDLRSIGRGAGRSHASVLGAVGLSVHLPTEPCSQGQSLPSFAGETNPETGVCRNTGPEPQAPLQAPFPVRMAGFQARGSPLLLHILPE